jgi:hypothetical protein
MQIFIPNKTGCNLDYLREVGLEQLLRDGDSMPMAVDVISNGPGGGGGIVFYWMRSTKLPGYHPEQQSWHAAKPDTSRNLPAARFYVSVDGDTPDTLLRDEAARLPGYFAELADGREWAIPNSAMLPFLFGIGDQGEIVRLPKRSVAPVAERMGWAFDSLERMLRDGAEVPWEEGISYAAEMLSLNYRLNRELCLLLGLLDSQSVGRILRFSIDAKTLQAKLETTAA